MLPDVYPLGDDVESYIAIEHGFGHLLDIGVIQPRLGPLYSWSSDALQLPALKTSSAARSPGMHGTSLMTPYGGSRLDSLAPCAEWFGADRPAQLVGGS